MNKIKELQVFIEAAEMIGGDDWAPTATQWQKIKAKIMSLEDAPPAAIYSPNIVHPPARNAVPESTMFSDPNQPQHTELMSMPGVARPPIPVPPDRGSLNPAMAASPEQNAKLKLNADGTPQSFI